MLDEDVHISGIPGYERTAKMRELWPGYGLDNDSFARKYFPQFAMGWANENHPATRHFFTKLKEQGYNAVVDMNDAGALSKQPMRLLDGSLFSIAGHETLTREAIITAQENIQALVHALEGFRMLYDDKPQLDEGLLVHYGVKGMHWGIRNDEGGGFRAQTSAVLIEPGLHPTTKKAATEVAGLIGERYGYQIRNVKVLGPGHPEYPGTAAFVESNLNKNGKNEGTVFIQARDLTKEMKNTENVGWMAPGCGNTRGLLTHESAHSMFHADQTVSSGFFGPKYSGGNLEARDKALKVALKTAKKDRVDIWDVSDYAKYAGNREELEAEFFSQYHWATNPPSFVQAWGQTLHQELGIDPTPFKEVK
jgi:hypothetical protein